MARWVFSPTSKKHTKQQAHEANDSNEHRQHSSCFLCSCFPFLMLPAHVVSAHCCRLLCVLLAYEFTPDSRFLLVRLILTPASCS
eukprot:scaffold147575_cov14-Tisochrysis_lutea.AAC.1